METDIVQLAKNYKEAQKALAKARNALVAAMEKDAKEVSPLASKKAASVKAKKAPPATPKKAPPAIPKMKAAAAKPKKAAPRGAPKNASASIWAPYRAALIKKMTKGQWITGFDARVYSGHEQGRGFTQNVLTYLLSKGVLKTRKKNTTTQWCLK
jgi:hypothetical protein